MKVHAELEGKEFQGINYNSVRGMLITKYLKNFNRDDFITKK